MNILLPINLDRFRSPITTLLREVACRLPEFKFHGFSSPVSDEDRELGGVFWAESGVRKVSPAIVLLKKFDIIWHASATPANVTLACISRLRGMNQTRHVFSANVEMGPDLKYEGWFRRALEISHIRVAVSEAVKTAVKRDFGVNINQVIPNGFDPESYNLLTVGKREDFFLFCGALTDRKRPDLLISLARALPDRKFIVVGSNPLPDQGDAYITEMEQLPNVDYLGHQSRANVTGFMRKAEALIFPSEREGLPLSVIEAMACGCPVLAQNKSSLPEVIIPGVNGWLLSDEPSEWASKCRLIRDADGKLFSSKQVRASVVDRFAWDQIAASYRDLFAGLRRPF